MTLVEQLFLSFFPTPFALGGAYMLKATYEGRKRAAAVEETGSTPVGELQPGDGPVVVEGSARAVGEDRVDAPMVGRDGVYVHTQIEERNAAPAGEARKTDWDTIYTETDAVPFAIDDGSGDVRIEVPDGGGVKLDPEVYEAEAGEEPPAPARRWLETTDVDVEDEVDDHKAYKEGVLEDGEAVYATGEAVVDDDGELVLTGEDHPDEFVITDLSREELADEEGYGMGGYAIGAVLLAIGVVPLTFIWLG